MTSYDVAILTDLRYPGGNSSSVVEEVKAQHAAGYTTALVHLPAGHMKRRRSFNHKLLHCLTTGMATLETGPLRTKLLVIRQPRIFADPLDRVPRIEAEHGLLVLNHPPDDAQTAPGEAYYDVREVKRRSEEAFGPLEWAPIGPSVRSAVQSSDPTAELSPTDWHNIIDVDEWRVDRSRYVDRIPVIGRHSREHDVKWLDAPDDLLAAYPERDDLRVEVLGGAEPARRALGRIPSNWTVHPFGSMAPQRFLRRIDLFVYFHHPGWIEAFGRNSIEAMASGAPVVLPPHFTELFGEAALYTEPAGVLDVVRDLYDRPAAYRERSQLVLDHVERHFGASVHVERLRRRIGDPARPTTASASMPPRVRVVLASLHRDKATAEAVERLEEVASDIAPLGVDRVLAVPGPGRPVAHRLGVLWLPLPAVADGAEGAAPACEVLRDVLEREAPDVLVLDTAEEPASLLPQLDGGHRVVVVPPSGAGRAAAAAAEVERLVADRRAAA